MICSLLTAFCAVPSHAADKPISLEFGHIQNPGHALYIAPEQFKKLVEERTGGRVVVNIYPASNLVLRVK